MPKFDPDAQSNIHDLTIEEPEQKESGVFFDPDCIITKEDVEKMTLDEILSKAYLELLGFDKEMEDNDWNELIQTAQLYKQEKRGAELAKLSGLLNIWGYAGEADNFLSQALWNKIEKTHPTYSTCVWASIAGKSLSTKIKAEMAQTANIRAKFDVDNFLRDDMDDVKMISGLAEEKIAGAKFEITDEMWKKIKNVARMWKGLHANSTASWDYFVELSANIAILAADEVRIPEGGGLELVHHEKPELKSETPEMPEQKQF